MKVVKRYRKRNDSGGYNHTDIEMTNVMVSKRNGHFLAVDYFKKIKVHPVDGRYMIKKQSLKYHNMSHNRIAYRKTYFVHALAGIAFTLNRNNNDIFYTNNWLVACRLAKLLTNSNTELISIVDRKDSGKETYVLNKSQSLSKDKIIVK